MWNKEGTKHEDVDTLGENVWQPGRVMVVGTLNGHEQFTRDKLHARVEEDRGNRFPVFSGLSGEPEQIVEPSGPQFRVCWERSEEVRLVYF